MAFNLTSMLTKEDRTKIENYIHLYGIKDGFVGIDEWLKYWGIEKIKLYKLLGKQFIYNFNYKYEMSYEERIKLFQPLRTHVFINQWVDFLHNVAEPVLCVKDDSEHSNFKSLWGMATIEILMKDQIVWPLKYKDPDEKKSLNLQKTTKPIRAIQKVIKFFEGKHNYDLSAFEDFKTAYSMIFNQKDEQLNISLSIHPLDFMTMSDNDSDWSSCMNWTNGANGGCYHLGTVEMLNSNNVIVAYINNKRPYAFWHNKETGSTDDYTWTNKRWRQLFYITPDIIVGGKAYPYKNDDITKRIINELRKLALDNLHWKYEFGIEKYLDMIHYTSTYAMNRMSDWIHSKDTRHQIIFDSKAMYNDMLNYNYLPYWCVRNKVNRAKKISYSGKAPCLHCMKSVTYMEDEYREYNERYRDSGKLICRDCYVNNKCSICGKLHFGKSHYSMTISNETDRPRIGIWWGKGDIICEDCAKERVKVCPCCGTPMYIFSSKNMISRINAYVGDPNKTKVSTITRNDVGYLKEDYSKLVNPDFIPLYFCEKCGTDFVNKGLIIWKHYGQQPYSVLDYNNDTYSIRLYTGNDYKNYTYNKLVMPNEPFENIKHLVRSFH